MIRKRHRLLHFTLYVFLGLFPVNHLFAQQVTFRNVADSLGINHTYIHSGLYGGGISFTDFNLDGWEDISFASGVGELVYLYRNDGSGFTNVASQFNLNDQQESQSLQWVDYDNDGDKDLFVTNFEGPCRLYRNDGLPNLIDVTASAGITTDSLPLSAACWVDYDNDGWLDLYITNRSQVLPNILYHNEGDGTFLDVTGIAGVGDTTQSPLAVAALDYDNDGWQDIYVANDRRRGNTLFHNNGDGTFTDVSAESHADLHFDAMGIAIGDYDNNGFLDLYVSNGPAGNGLLRNNGDGTFTDVADSLGMLVNKICWGTNFFDYDNDGDLDLYVCVSGGNPDRRNTFFENNGDGTFSQPVGIGLDNDLYESYSVATGDFDNNGYPDMAVLNENDPSCLWQNSGGANNWLKITLEGTVSNRDAIGSRVEIWRNGERMIRTTHCGISYLAQNSSDLLIGVNSTTLVDSIIVRWSSGLGDVVQNVSVNQHIHIREGEGVVTGIMPHPTAPAGFFLKQNYPNPFNPGTAISYQLIAVSDVELTIYNLLGERVKTLVSRQQAAGVYTVLWDGRDDAEEPVASGVYIDRLVVKPASPTGSPPGAIVQTRKMMLLR